MNTHKFLIGASLTLAVIAVLTCAMSAPGSVVSAAAPAATATSKVTVAPTATPAPTPPTVMSGTVKSKTGDVHSGPGTAFQIVETVKQGEKINLTGRTNDNAWLQVCCYKNIPGWISAGLVTLGGKVGSLPVPPTAPPTVTASPASAAPRAAAKKTVNLRAGPGTGYPTLGSAKAGQSFDIVGKNQGGSWWQVCCIGAAKQKAWLLSSLVTATGNAGAVQLARDIPTPAPKPTSSPTVAKRSQPPAQPTSADSDPNLGCYLIQNQIGAELNVTITAVDWKWRDNFKLAPMTERVCCLSPGHYTYTLDCPPPWADLNGQLTVEAGDRYLWPVRGEVQ